MTREKYRKTRDLLRVASTALTAAALIAAFVIWWPALKTYDGRKPAGIVNRAPFFQEDLDIYAMELRAAVAVSYSRKYGIFGMGEDFWDTRYGAETPRETLNMMALGQLARNMVILEEARKRGLDAPGSYGALEAERAARNAAAEAGGVVYGPLRAGPGEYASYRLTEVTNALKTALLQKELRPSEADLRAAYASLPEGLKTAPFTARGLRATPDPAGGAPLEEPFEFSSAAMSREDPYQTALAAALEAARPGDTVAAPLGEPGWYRVEAKEGGHVMKFEEAPGLGRNKWINDRFEEFVRKRLGKAFILFNGKVISPKRLVF